MNAKLMTFQGTSFTPGDMAVSVYEYLPKQYMILGGSSRMERMYNSSINAAENHIFFRRIVPENKDRLISGDVQVLEMSPNGTQVVADPKGQHHGCSFGGMVGIGAKLFDRNTHMDMARRLVNGCVWAYDDMPSGITPEVLHLVACDEKDCT